MSFEGSEDGEEVDRDTDAEAQESGYGGGRNESATMALGITETKLGSSWALRTVFSRLQIEH